MCDRFDLDYKHITIQEQETTVPGSLQRWYHRQQWQPNLSG